jgi:hypothetical protein
MPCNLKASGDTFPVEEFLARTTLKIGSFCIKGKPRPFKSRLDGDCYDTSGLCVNVSGAGFHNFPGQVRSAIKFLTKNERELMRLAGFQGVREIVLHFGVFLGSMPGYATADYVLPPALLRLAARLKTTIVITHYPIKPPKTQATQ